jgi:hypothetical protein
MSVLWVLFFSFDAITKIIRAAPAKEGSIQIGWPREMVQGIGIVLLACSIHYLIPRTSMLGAIVLTGYLGGAASLIIRAGMVEHPYFFPIVFEILIWAALYIREESLQPLIPLKKKSS